MVTGDGKSKGPSQLSVFLERERGTGGRMVDVLAFPGDVALEALLVLAEVVPEPCQAGSFASSKRGCKGRGSLSYLPEVTFKQLPLCPRTARPTVRKECQGHHSEPKLLVASIAAPNLRPSPCCGVPRTEYRKSRCLSSAAPGESGPPVGIYIHPTYRAL